MKRLILLLLCSTALALPGCGTTIDTTSKTSAAIQEAEGAAASTLYAAGAVLQATKSTCDALYDAGKITKDQYNSVVPIYNRAKASFDAAVKALQTVVDAGQQDPSNITDYTTALATFLADSTTVQNLVTALGGTK